jgi:hypothetical protein
VMMNFLDMVQVMCPTCLCTGMALASEHDPRIDPFQWHCQWMCILSWRHDKIYTPNNCSLEQRLWVMVFGLSSLSRVSVFMWVYTVPFGFFRNWFEV